MTDDMFCGNATCFLAEMPGVQVVPHLVRVIAKGQPVSVDELADLAAQPVGTVEQLLRNQPGTDWDEDGRLLGFGLTLRPTANRFVVAGRTLYTFCATDALLFTHVLGQPSVAASLCPVTSKPIRIELTPDAVVSVDPATTVVSQPLLDCDALGDVRHNVCEHGHFFASADGASAWRSEHPDGIVVSVDEAFERSRRDAAELGWLPGGGMTRPGAGR